MHQFVFSTIFFYTLYLLNFVNGQLTATLKYAYYSPLSNYTNITEEIQVNGIVSSNGSQEPVYNRSVFTWKNELERYDGCQPIVNPMNYSNGIIIIHRGGDCTFSTKITRAKQYGAAAVIIYDPQNNGHDVLDMLHNNSNILAIYVQRTIGVYLFNLANKKQTRLNLTIEPTTMEHENSNSGGLWNTSRSVVVFIVVTISVLVFLCLLCIFVYYCRRRRTRTAKDRLQDRLLNAAKKALNKIPLITITENSSVNESCVICLDAINVGDTIRQIACGHTFHQHCVDPWLLTHRHCPLCNLDILVAYRITVPGVNNTHQTYPETSTNTNDHYSTSMNFTTVQQTINSNEQQMQTVVPISSISATINKDEENSSIRNDTQMEERSEV